jgi:hypothetical protein
MKSHTAVAFLLLVSIPVAAQIPNASFESWNADTTVVDWLTNTSPVYPTVTRTSPGHSGAYALKGTVVFSTIIGIAPVVLAGPDGVFPFTQRPAALTGWYKFSPASPSDYFQVSVSTFQAATGTPVATGSMGFGTSTPNFTEFSVPLVPLTDATPDTAYVLFSVGHGVGSDWPAPGTFFVIDDIAFGASTGAPEPPAPVPGSYALSQNYPNPFNPGTEIRYQISGVSPVKLVVYDMLGRTVAVLVDETKEPGTYSVRFDASSLSSGVYMYRLEAGSYTATRRMMLLK